MPERENQMTNEPVETNPPIESYIENYKGKTFVAFLDMCGFKQMMKKDLKNAGDKLDFFFETIYDATDFSNIVAQLETPYEISVIAISDCAIIFPRIQKDTYNTPSDLKEGLEVLLSYIKGVNERLLEKGILTTTSIAYGDFEYQNRIQLKNLRKTIFIGNPYLEAYLDNESDNPKLRPGECRILRKTLPDKEFFITALGHPNSIIHNLKVEDENYLYFYWINSKLGIDEFRDKYDKLYEKLYPDITNLFKEYTKYEVPNC